MTEATFQQIKADNNKEIERRGYTVNPHLPFLEAPRLRELSEVHERMAILHGLLQISFGAPTELIKGWIEENNLAEGLTEWETSVLDRDEEDVDSAEKNQLRWYIECLWTLMWCLGMVEDLDERNWCGDVMASLLPDLQAGDSDEKITSETKTRSLIDLISKLDYYYRLHWYCVEERLNGRTAKINEGLVYERRKALEWLLCEDYGWDDVEMGT